MKEVDPTELLRLLLSQGLTVCYADADDVRRAKARLVAKRQMATRDHFCDLFSLPLSTALCHYDVTIAVNPPPDYLMSRQPSATRWSDWKFIGATNITVDTPETPKGPAVSPQSPPDVL